MYFLYGAVALWLVGELAGLLGRIKAKVSFNYWLGSTALLLSRGMLFWFIYSFANAVGTVFGVVFKNLQAIAAHAGMI